MMMSKEVENIITELEQLGCSQLIDLHSVNCYSRPTEAYWMSNVSSIEEKGMLFPISRAQVLEVPQGYFEDLSDSIQDIVSQSDEVETTGFSFESNKVSMPFALPENYFEQLRADFLETETYIYEKKEKAKVISFFQNLNKYVAAAVILVLFSVGGNIMIRVKEERKAFQMLNNMNINNELADIPTEEIFNYLNQSSSKNLEYLIKPNNDLINKAISQDGNVEKAPSKGVSDSDILQFLSDEDHGF